MKSILPSVESDQRPFVRISCSVLAIFALWFGSGDAQARPPMLDHFFAGAEDRSRPDRRTDLRQSLSPRDDRDESSQARRKLSSEERSALRRDLRDAMRGAYPEEPRPKKKY